MSEQRWKPSVTVAAVIEQHGRYLLVEEETPDGLQLNNPAGHLEPGESPPQGVIREALEETGHPFTPTALVGLYMATTTLKTSGVSNTYLRIAYTGTVAAAVPGHTLDQGIIRVVWMTLAEVRDSAARHRSPLVLQCVEDHAKGQRFAMDLIHVDPSALQPCTQSMAG